MTKEELEETYHKTTYGHADWGPKANQLIRDLVQEVKELQEKIIKLYQTEDFLTESLDKAANNHLTDLMRIGTLEKQVSSLKEENEVLKYQLAEAREEIERLKEYEWKYKDLEF